MGRWLVGWWGHEGTENDYFLGLAGNPAGYRSNHLIAFRDGQHQYPRMNYLLAYLPDDYLTGVEIPSALAIRVGGGNLETDATGFDDEYKPMPYMPSMLACGFFDGRVRNIARTQARRKLN